MKPTDPATVEGMTAEWITNRIQEAMDPTDPGDYDAERAAILETLKLYLPNYVKAAEDAARREEREECAKVAFRVPLDAGSIAAQTQEAIAAAIRARGNR